MLKILSMYGGSQVPYWQAFHTGKELFKHNPRLELVIEAPMYWWLDCEFEHYNFIFPKKENGLDFCLDEWENPSDEISFIRIRLAQNKNLSDRQLMQILPLGTIISGRIILDYHKIVEICENYRYGEYKYQGLKNQWATEREWTDFCETLLDIKGIRDLVEA